MIEITTIDVHVAGEPLRVITKGFPDPQGSSILDKREYCRQHFDHLRQALMLEPRGHPDMYGALPLNPSRADADIGVLFMHNEGYSTMCGHGIIGLTTVLLEEENPLTEKLKNPLRIETPSGMVTAKAQHQEGRIASVTFQNIPSFVEGLDFQVDVPNLGRVRYDLAFGGAYYAFCQAEDFGLSLTPQQASSLVELGMRIKQAIMARFPIEHPQDERLGFLYGVIFVGPGLQQGAYCRQVCVFAEGAVDRSPTGTGVSAHLAILATRHNLQEHTQYHMEGILGSTFTVRLVKRCDFFGRQAFIPEVTGQAYITGKHQFLIDPADPLKEGFRLS